MKKNSVLTLVMMTLIITLSSFMNAEHQSEESYNIKRIHQKQPGYNMGIHKRIFCYKLFVFNNNYIDTYIN